jgi:hypothetical protein
MEGLGLFYFQIKSNPAFSSFPPSPLRGEGRDEGDVKFSFRPDCNHNRSRGFKFKADFERF